MIIFNHGEIFLCSYFISNLNQTYVSLFYNPRRSELPSNNQKKSHSCHKNSGVLFQVSVALFRNYTAVPKQVSQQLSDNSATALYDVVLGAEESKLQLRLAFVI